MSVSLLLIPGALAIVGAVGGVGALGLSSQLKTERRAGAEGATTEAGSSTVEEDVSVPIQVRTRMKDTVLLAAALEDLGAQSLSVAEHEVSASVDGRDLTMVRNPEGIWQAHVESANEAEATELMAKLDARYALRVQQTVAERIRQRAEGAGLTLLSETRASDQSLTMVLEVREGH